MSDVSLIKNAIVSIEAQLGVCIKEMASGPVYATRNASLAMDLVNFKAYLEKQLPVVKKVVKKTTKVVKGKEVL